MNLSSYIMGIVLVAPLLLQYVYAQSAALVVLDEASFVDDAGFFHIIGEIKNNGSSPVRFVSMPTTFYDASGATLGTATGYPYVVVIHPQEKSAFDIILLDSAKSHQVASYSFDITSQPASTKPAALKLTLDEGFHDSLGFYHAIGTVENRASNTATLVSISSAFYDKNGNVVAVGQEYADTLDLKAGETTSFEIIILEGNVQAIDDTSANVDSSQYRMIPSTASSPAQPSSGPSSDTGSSEQPSTPQSPQAVTTNSTITIELDKPTYRHGEYITVSGNVTNMVPNEKLVVTTVTFPGQVPYSRYTAPLDSSGNYERTFLFLGKPGTEDQSYIVEAIYNGAIAYTEFLYHMESSRPAKQLTHAFDASVLFTTFNSSPDSIIANSRFQSASPVLVTTTILSTKAQETPVSIIIEIRDTDGFTIDLQIIPASLHTGSVAKIGTLWTPPDSGKYQVRTFAISNSEALKVLSSVSSSIIDVG